MCELGYSFFIAVKIEESLCASVHNTANYTAVYSINL